MRMFLLHKKESTHHGLSLGNVIRQDTLVKLHDFDSPKRTLESHEHISF